MLVRIKQITIGKRWSALVVCLLLSSVYGLYDQMKEASLTRLMAATLRDCRTKGIQCGKYHFMFASTKVVFSKGRETIPFLSEKTISLLFSPAPHLPHLFIGQYFRFSTKRISIGHPLITGNAMKRIIYVLPPSLASSLFSPF